LWDECKAIIGEAWAKTRDKSSPLASTKDRIEICGEDMQARGSSKTHP